MQYSDTIEIRVFSKRVYEIKYTRLNILILNLIIYSISFD